MNKKILAILLFALLCAAAPAKQRKATSASIKKEQAQNNAQIKETQRKIDENKAKTRKQINALNSLNGQIDNTKRDITDLNKRITTIAGQQQTLADSIAILQSNVNKLKVQGARSLHEARRKHKGLSEIGMIFSAESFVQLLKRSCHIQQANQRAVRKTDRLLAEVHTLEHARLRLDSLKLEMNSTAAQLARQRAALDEQQAKTQSMVNDLKKQGESLQRVMAEKREKARKLDNQLERLIREEQQRAEQQRQEQQRKERERQQAEQRRQNQQNKQSANNANNSAGNKANNSANSKANNSANNSSANRSSAVAPTPDAKLTGSFASNKGKLLFPVSGRYSIVGFFGRNNYLNLPGVEVQNSGIDIEAQPGANARAAFDGTVSSIFYIDGYQNVVMVRHGEYLTVYGHIKSPSVSKGAKVKAGQSIGSIYPDPLDGNRVILHFEVRKETTKLNPLEWVRR